MKKVCLFFSVLFCSLCCLCSAFASPQHALTSKQIMITDNGILINVNGQVLTTEAVSYVGNGLYTMSQTYYGSCGRCGWPLDESGRCKNQNCNGYGPPDR